MDAASGYSSGPQGTGSLVKTLRSKRDQISVTAGYCFGYIAGFLIIFAIGLVVLGITREPEH